MEEIADIAVGIVEIGAEASSGEGKRGCGCFVLSIIIATVLVCLYIYFS